MRYSMQKWFSGDFTGSVRELLDHRSSSLAGDLFRRAVRARVRADS
jgi:hypothetical protein